jgi:hypothetical protein
VGILMHITSIEVGDKHVAEEFSKIFKCPPMMRCKAIVETGTYKGLGTTQRVIDAWERVGKKTKRGDKPQFITIEASEENYRDSCENLRDHYDWIDVRHGLTLYKDECIEFIENDVFCVSPSLPEFYGLKTDNPNPIEFYSKETRGQLFGAGNEGVEGIFYKIIPEVIKKNPLFVLDSCGGIGLLEYARVLELMDGNRFYVWLHDIDHVKHFRSYKHLRDADGVEILAESEEKEWVLARFNRNKSVSKKYNAAEIIDECNANL